MGVQICIKMKVQIKRNVAEKCKAYGDKKIFTSGLSFTWIIVWRPKYVNLVLKFASVFSKHSQFTNTQKSLIATR